MNNVQNIRNPSRSENEQFIGKLGHTLKPILRNELNLDETEIINDHTEEDYHTEHT